MMDYQERLKRLDEEAEELVQNLSALKEKALLFDNAQQGLNATRKHIDDLITESSTLSISLKNLVTKLNDLNTPTINEKLDNVVVNSTNAIQWVIATKNTLQAHIDNYIADYDDTRSNTLFLRKMMMLLLAISGVSLVISIISLLL
jgi:predicted nuclease with TOPRIM domain